MRTSHWLCIYAPRSPPFATLRGGNGGFKKGPLGIGRITIENLLIIASARRRGLGTIDRNSRTPTPTTANTFRMGSQNKRAKEFLRYHSVRCIVPPVFLQDQILLGWALICNDNASICSDDRGWYEERLYAIKKRDSTNNAATINMVYRKKEAMLKTNTATTNT